MGLVNGKDAVFETYDGGVWKFIGCARSFSLVINRGMLETTVTGDGNAATYVPGKYSFTGTVEGLTNLDLGGGVSLPYLDNCILNGVLMRCRDIITDLNGNTYSREFKFYAVSVTSVNSFDNVSTFTVELQGTGVITQTFIIPPIITGLVKRYPAIDQVVEQATGFDVVIPDLIGKDILEVVKDGLGRAELISAGSPVDKQVLYDSPTGTFTFGIPFEGDEKYYILYQD